MSHDLPAKYGVTPLLFSGKVVSLIARGKYEEAYPSLQGSFEKGIYNVEALINLMALFNFTGKKSQREGSFY